MIPHEMLQWNDFGNPISEFMVKQSILGFGLPSD
jgi:hypothetical protein